MGFTASGSVGGSGPGMGNIEIRGVSSTGGEATTAIYYDDAPMMVKNIYTIGAAEPKYFDIDRIEVLRGPQGTLYGASAMGGTIRIQSKQPDLTQTTIDANTEMSETRGGGFNYQINSVVNIPVVANVLAIRFGAEVGDNDGWIDRYSLLLDENENPSPGSLQATHINSDEWKVAKLSIKYTPDDALSITPSVFYQREQTGDTNTTSIFMSQNQVAKNTPEPGTDTLVLPSLVVKYDAGFSDLTSVTSYFYRNFDRTQDGQGTNSEYIATLTTGVTSQFDAALANLPSPIALTNKVEQGTEELRLTSKPYVPQSGGLPLTWITGVYYSDQRFSLTDIETIPGINALFADNGYTFPVNLPNPPGPGLPASTNPNYYFPNDYDFYAKRNFDEKQRAVFGELGYYVTPELKVIVGGRYLSATQALNVYQNYFFGPGPTSQSGKVDSSAFTPKFALTYDLNPHETLYATAAKGFRLGGNNRQPPVTFCGESSPNYAGDSLWSYELGDKGTYFDNHLLVNASVFLIKWKNIQQDLDLACGYVTEINAGDAQSYGAELELKAKVTHGLTVGLVGSINHATLTSEAGTLSLPAPAGGDVHAGDYIAGVPVYNTVVNAEQSFRINDNWSGYARADVDFIGHSHGSLSEYEIGSTTMNPDYMRPSYHTVNARVAAQYGSWEFAVFAANLLNENKIIQHVNVQYVEQAYRLTPQTLGLSFAIHF